MKDLRLYKGFRLLELTPDYPIFLKAKAEIDGLTYSSYLSKRCTCSETVNPRTHKQGCNANWVPNCPKPYNIIGSKTEYEIIEVRRIRKEDYYDLVVKVGNIIWDGLIHIDCTCGMYHSGNRVSDHPHRDCQVRKKLLQQESCTTH